MQMLHWNPHKWAGSLCLIASWNACADITQPGVPRLRFSAAADGDFQRQQQQPEPHAVLSSHPLNLKFAWDADVSRNSGSNADGSIVLLQVRLNGQDFDDVYRGLQLNDGSLLMRAEDLNKWRLRMPFRPEKRLGEDYVALDTVPGLHYRFDGAAQSVSIQTSSELIESNRINLVPDSVVTPSVPGWGGFLNYDVSALRSSGTSSFSSLVELGAFSPWGVLTNTYLGQSLHGERSGVRLDTTLTRDFPQRRMTLRMGDALTQPGMGGGSVRFGGVQWATNYGTQPGFIPYPLPNVRGEATVPSTVDIFINNASRGQTQTPAGPFEITRLPVVTGQGEVRLVQRDLLGREVVVTVPYYASQQLLRPGLHEIGYQAGFIRENYSVESEDYGRAFVSATHRLGLSERLTGEARAELLGSQQTVGVGAAYLFPTLGTVSAALAGSHSQMGSGVLGLLQAERVTLGLSFGARVQLASRAFTQLGANPTFPIPSRLIGVNAGYSFGAGSFSVSYTEQQRHDAETMRITTASYNLPLSSDFYLSFTALQTQGSSANRTFAIALVKALDSRTTLAANVTRQGHRDGSLLQIQQNLPSDSGTAFRVLAGTGVSERLEAGLALQTDWGVYTVETGRAAGIQSSRASAAGGISTMDGSLFFSRRVDDSFTVVSVPGYKDIGVYQSNRLVTRTNEKGKALLTRMLPYQENKVRIQTEDLPLDAEVSAQELSAVPYFRSGVVLEFPVRSSGGALFELIGADGAPVAEGATVRIKGKPGEFFVARRGEVYVTGIVNGDRLEVAWGQNRCEIAVQIPPAAGPLPRIGPLTCVGSK